MDDNKLLSLVYLSPLLLILAGIIRGIIVRRRAR